ncbi:YqjF family protein [Algoriphagus sp. Y33]|uniref:YqjF family protein n=1 Tax=Algoriphagus sp. Y33 TaxID=2772483 RepID=UPI001CE08E93|nr:DUF2071 domain-containing protein [Algoriphagus sp. Y33]
MKKINLIFALNREMTIKEILNSREHRPWEMPTEKWKYYQEWNNAIFLHWQVDYRELRALVPTDLEIDLFDGKAWVSLVAFTMEKIRPRILPAFPPISNFDEINVRTYVKNGKKTGVYFLSIEGGNRVSCKVARTLSKLPYRYSKMKRGRGLFRSVNKLYNDKMKIAYEIGHELKEKTDLDRWLTERYALFQDTKTSINEFEIHHVEWPVYELEKIELEIEYVRFGEFLKTFPDRMHYSTGVQVIAWDKKKSE